MDPGYLLTANGRYSPVKVGWEQTWRPHNLEWKNLHVYKSFTGAPRCKWPLSLSMRRFPKKLLPGILGVDCKSITEGSSEGGLSMTIDAEEKDTQLAEEYGNNSDSSASADVSSSYFGEPIGRTELESIRVDSIRAKLIRKLSEANQYNRHLKRQVYDKEQALIKCKNELAVTEVELQELVRLAQEVARNGTKPGSRKINGKYIHSHLALRLEELFDKLRVQIKDVDVAQFHEVPLVFYAMAEGNNVYYQLIVQNGCWINSCKKDGRQGWEGARDYKEKWDERIQQYKATSNKPSDFHINYFMDCIAQNYVNTSVAP